MLEKIVHIKSIGRFRNYSANGDVTFRKLSLVYAENGRGKTTLCAILRSLQTGQKEYITERKTLADATPSEVFLRLGGADYRYSSDAWRDTHANVLIFDPVFINENVYSGDYVEHEHKKNLYRVIVGEQGVKLAEQIEELDRKIRDANGDLRTKKETVSKHVPSDTRLDDYLQWKPVDGIEEQIRQKTEDLDARQRAAQKSDEIQSKGLLLKVKLPALPSDFADILAKQLENVVVDAETKVRAQITRHKMGGHGEAWLSQGVGYVRDDECPFCGQGVQANALLAAYRSHFSDAYKGLKQEVSELSQRVNDAIGETLSGSDKKGEVSQEPEKADGSKSSLTHVQEVISGNAVSAEFWKQFTKVNLPTMPFQEIKRKFADLREQCVALAERKQQNPIEAVVPNPAFNKALTEVEALQATVNAYNAVVDETNVRINEQKVAVGSQASIAALKSEIASLEDRKKRFESTVMLACQEYLNAAITKSKLELEKATKREKLDQHCQDLLMAYEHSINEYLDQFNAGFRITNSRHLYTGGTPSSHYQIEINSSALDLGDARTPAGTPCFKTALSSGDRTALALAFFLAVLKQDAEIGQKIVVFDDPFTSLDRFRRTCTQQLIQRLSESAKQVIVLSHDPLFLKLLFDERPSAAADVKTLQMSRAGDTTVIGEWDIQADAQSSYMKDFSALLGFYRDRKGDPRSIARTIRPFLEGLYRVHFPGHFPQNEWLGDFIRKIREADPSRGLQHAKADLGELDAINSYSKKYHHQQNSNADSEPINDDELHGFVKRTLRLVGGN